MFYNLQSYILQISAWQLERVEELCWEVHIMAVSACPHRDRFIHACSTCALFGGFIV